MNNYKLILLISVLITSKAYSQDVKNDSTESLILKQIQETPENSLAILFYNPNVRFADSLIKISASVQPEKLYIFAQAKKTALGKLIHASKDPLVSLIAKLSTLNAGMLYFPFLDNLLTGKISLEDISKTFGIKNKVAYYKLLVDTQIDYISQQKNNIRIIAANSMTSMLKLQALNEFVTVVNELHDKPDEIRFRVLKPLSYKYLYYLCISNENELYTSSYLKIYRLMFEDRQPINSYRLLEEVNFDHFRLFIKMAGNFNTLKDFLSRMEHGKADSLMRSFVTGLEGPEGLQDAVDVADSYASMPSIQLDSLILKEVQKNLTALTLSNNKKGATIYGLLNTIFLSLDSSKNIDISERLGIPPVYRLNYDLLKDSMGKVIIQQFFYGDADGKSQFAKFIKSYSNKDWKITEKKEWLEVQSITGKPVIIYSNKPLDEENYLDEKAQEALGKFLAQNNTKPTIVIHRGHSYFLQHTISQLAVNARLVLLGSCGGYNNLSQVIKTCPYVHIIATKQLGSGSVNQPMIIKITDLLRQGEDLYWPSIWKDFEDTFKDNELFKDYIPPHKNLGAIFIMAYNKAMGF